MGCEKYDAADGCGPAVKRGAGAARYGADETAGAADDEAGGGCVGATEAAEI